MVKRLRKSKDPRILKDGLIVFTTPQSKAAYPGQLRRVTALVELDGEERVMVFLTNNLEWSPTSVAELYRCRGKSRCFSSRSNRLCNWPTSSATTPTQSTGSCGGAASLRAAALPGLAGFILNPAIESAAGGRCPSDR